MLGKLLRLYNDFKIKKCINGGLKIGSNCRIMTKPSNFGSEPYLVRIGDNCVVAADVRFITHDGATSVIRRMPEFRNVNKYGSINIMDNCMIGIGAIILPGVTIGPDSIVGAGSVVTRDVATGTCAAGNPARFICTVAQYAEKASKHYLRMPENPRYKRSYLERYFWSE